MYGKKNPKKEGGGECGSGCGWGKRRPQGMPIFQFGASIVFISASFNAAFLLVGY